MSARRPWTYAAGGALAAAVVVAGIAVAGDRLGPSGSGERQRPGSASAGRSTSSPARTPSPAPTSSTSPGDAPSPAASPAPSPGAPTVEPGGDLVVAAYYLGDGAAGPRLFREFRRVTATDPLDAGLTVLQGAPHDPDYRTAWPQGSFDHATFEGSGDDGTIAVELADFGLAGRPPGMSRAEARLALQQVVHTLQAAVQARPGVSFYLEGRHVSQVYGVPTVAPLRNAAPLDVLSHMSVTTPEEGAVVSGTFQATGVGSSPEANVRWEVRRGDETLLDGYTTADGWMDRLYPWRTDPIDTSGLEPGTYTFVASTDDASAGEAGAEGAGPDVDTRTIVVR